MMTNNPFAVLAESIPSIFLQSFVIIMVAFVIIGTLIDIIHKTTFLHGADKGFLNQFIGLI